MVIAVIIVVVMFLVVFWLETEERLQSRDSAAENTMLLCAVLVRQWRRRYELCELVQRLGGLDVEGDRGVLDFADRVGEFGELDVVFELLGDSFDPVQMRSAYLGTARTSVYLLREILGELIGVLGGVDRQNDRINSSQSCRCIPYQSLRSRILH